VRVLVEFPVAFFLHELGEFFIVLGKMADRSSESNA
jgi:hypothetical protein